MTILNTIQVMEPNIIYIIFSVCTIIFGFSLFRYALTHDHNAKISTAILFASIIVLAAGGVAFIRFSTDTTLYKNSGKTRIEALISDDMPFNAIYDQYEIIEKRGDIYLLESREYDSE